MTHTRWLYCVLVVATGSLLSAPARSGDGVVALQIAAPSCPDDSSNIYIDCGNGTITDNRTGLVWLKSSNCFGDLDWFEAMAAIAGLGDLDCGVSEGEGCDCGLSDGSSPGECSLPSRKEWKAMVADAVTLGCVSSEYGGPSITDDSGEQCWQEGPGNSFTGVQLSWYRSSSTSVPFPTSAWVVNLNTGDVPTYDKPSAFFVWPVRGGQ